MQFWVRLGVQLPGTEDLCGEYRYFVRNRFLHPSFIGKAAYSILSASDQTAKWNVPGCNTGSFDNYNVNDWYKEVNGT